MSAPSFKKPILSAIAFFWTLGILSVGYSAYVSSYPATATAGVTVLSAGEWNKMVSALQTLDGKLSTFTITDGGNVWIWPSAPSTPLEIGNGTTVRGYVKLNNDSVNSPVLQLANGIAWGRTYNIYSGFYANTGSLVFADLTAGNVARMTLDGNGNVWIGTASPIEKLDVVGTVKTSVGIAFPDGNTQTKAFQGIMTIRQNNIGSFSLANGASVTHTANCQAGEIATGGGCQDGGYKDFYFWQPGTNAYSCGWYNTSGASRNYAGAMVFVNCLK